MGHPLGDYGSTGCGGGHSKATGLLSGICGERQLGCIIEQINVQNPIILSPGGGIFFGVYHDRMYFKEKKRLNFG